MVPVTKRAALTHPVMKRVTFLLVFLFSPTLFADEPARLENWALLDKDGVSNQGSYGDARTARTYQKAGEALWYVRRDGKAYVIRDEAVLARVRAAWAATEELGHKMGAVGTRMGAVGDKQRAVGEKMGAIGARMGAVGVRLADSRLDRGERAKLRKEMDALSDEMEPLQAQMEKYSEEMRPFSTEMEKMGKEMQRLVSKGQADLLVIFEDARSRGLATPVK